MKRQKVRIGYKDYKISFVKRVDIQKSCGECDNTLGTIRIDKELKDIERANTVLHEVMHAIFYTQGLQLTAKQEELIVTSITNGLIGFSRDNREFFDSVFKLVK